MRIEVAVALIPVLAVLSVDNRKLLKATQAVSPLPDVVAKFADRLPEANGVLDFLDVVTAMELPPLLA